MYVANARYCTSARILFARSRRSVEYFLILFFPDTRRQENILRNITRSRVTGAVWIARHASPTRTRLTSVPVFKNVDRVCWKCDTPTRGRAAVREPEFMTTNSSVTRSLADGTRSGFIGERGTTFLETMHLPLAHLRMCCK